jgi:hypothetical protein
MVRIHHRYHLGMCNEVEAKMNPIGLTVPAPTLLPGTSEWADAVREEDRKRKLRSMALRKLSPEEKEVLGLK